MHGRRAGTDAVLLGVLVDEVDVLVRQADAELHGRDRTLIRPWMLPLCYRRTRSSAFASVTA